MIAKGTQLAKRLIWSFALVGICAYTIFLSPAWFFLLVVEAFVLTGLWEYFNLAEKKGFFVNRYLGLLFGMLLPIPYYFPGDAIVITTSVLCIFIFNFHKSLKEHAIVSTAITLFGLIYVAWFFSFLAKIHALPNGAVWVFYTVLLTKGGDAAAYFVGKKYGANKLVRHISPNKSIEGAIGGFVATFLLSLLSVIYLPQVPFWHLIMLGIVIGVVSQLGDLSESLLKRDAGVKDSGSIPGLGGVLDIIDSLLFPIPIVYYYLIVSTAI